jgi:mono/diheme cytochrome c family protein
MKGLTPANIIAGVWAALLAAATVTGTVRSGIAQADQAGRAEVRASARPMTLSIEAPPSPAPSVARGRYLVRIGGCNDCHTPGYGELGGHMPDAQWLTGSDVGFRGPWGISYPSNLRLTVQHIDEEQWLVFARSRRLPPMPWFSLDAMSENDLRSIYRFIHFLGPKGATAPTALPPGQQSATPFIPFVPQTSRNPG